MKTYPVPQTVLIKTGFWGLSFNFWRSRLMVIHDRVGEEGIAVVLFEQVRADMVKALGEEPARQRALM